MGALVSAFIRVEGLPALEKALDALDGKDRQNALRRGVRAAAKPIQAALKEAAVGANVPRSFQNVPAAKISTHGGATGRGVEARIRPKSPLFNIFEPGAGEHEIAPHAKALYGPAGSGGWDPKGRKRPAAFFSASAVRHPGMRARPIRPQAFAAGEAAAKEAFAAAIFGTGETKA